MASVTSPRLLALLVLLLTAGGATAQPVRVLLDTDLGPDAAGALAVLHALADRGEAEILSVACGTASPWCAPDADAINTYYGRPDLPVGTNRGEGPAGGSEAGYGDAFNGYLAGHFPNDTRHAEYAEDAVVLYRRLLAAAPDTSVAVVAVGPLTNLVRVLESPADRLSPLSGRDLVAQKGRLLSVMGGRHPAGVQRGDGHPGRAPAFPAAHHDGLPDGFFLENAASGATFNTPTAVAVAPGGRLFVAEKRGRVYVVENGFRLETPFVDLQDEVLDHGDRGLLGLALDPDFAANGYVYLYYAVDHDGTGDRDRYDAFARLTRFTASAADPNVADPASRHVLIGETFSTGIPACHLSHNGGSILFGTDGTLLLTTGDGASYTQVDAGGLYPDCFGPGRFDPSEDVGAFRAGRPSSLAGKVLRLDPETGRGLPSNPFYTGDPDEAASKVWAYGLRNPFRAAIRANGSLDPADGRPGALYLGDVGWTRWEELQPVRGGEYFGWPCFEGPLPHNGYQAAQPATDGCGAVPEPTPPTYYWSHGDPASSLPSGLLGYTILGGAFYEGTRYPEAYRGVFFYADFAAGWMAYARVSDDDRLLSHTVFHDAAGFLVDLTYDPVREELLLVDIANGVVSRLRYADPGTNDAPVAIATASPPIGPVPLTVHFDGSGSFDPDGDALANAWDFGDGAGSTLASPEFTFEAVGSYSVRLTVSDPFGAAGVTQLAVVVGEGSVPTAAIVEPADGAAVQPGDVLTLTAEAEDPDQPAATLAYRWEAVQIHNGHEHPDFLEATDPTATFTVPAHGNDGDVVSYRVRLTVTDDAGFVASDAVALWVKTDHETDVTDYATAPIALVTEPQGGGSYDLETIRDGVAPDRGSCDPAFQYDTYTGPDDTREEDWVGYAFGETHTFSRLSFQEGCHFGDGGWFEELRVEVRQDSVWTAVPFLTAFPGYRGADEVDYDTYALLFRATEGDAIRLIGTPGGEARFISVGELRVLALHEPPRPDWTSADVGPVETPGAFAQDGRSFTVEGGGDLWGDRDRFHFAYLPLHGDGSLTVRLESLAAPHDWAKAGVMVRASLDPQAAHAMLVGTPGHGVHLQARPAAEADTEWLGGVDLPVPVWLRIQRLGEQVTGFASADGVTWEVVGTAALDLGEDVLIGLPVASADYEGRGLAALARFTDVRPTGVFDREPPAPGTPPAGPPFAIERVYPNPFNPATTVRLAVDQPGLYRVEVYDVLGRRVRERQVRPEAPGMAELTLRLDGMASGTYVVRAFRASGDGPVATKAVTLLR